jgi:hypothetical protein
MKKTDSAAAKRLQTARQAFYQRCDAENTVAQTCVIVNGFLVGTPLAWQLVRDANV